MSVAAVWKCSSILQSPVICSQTSKVKGFLTRPLRSASALRLSCPWRGLRTACACLGSVHCCCDNRQAPTSTGSGGSGLASPFSSRRVPAWTQACFWARLGAHPPFFLAGVTQKRMRTPDRTTIRCFNSSRPLYPSPRAPRELIRLS